MEKHFNECEYNIELNLCAQVINGSANCTTDYIFTGEPPNFECTPCVEGEKSENGVKCINQCEYDSKTNRCVNSSDTSSFWLIM